MSYVAGKNYIVTGASRGLGLAATNSLIRRAARVAAFGRDEEALARLQAIHGAAVRTMQVDVADRVALVKAIDETAAAFGGLDGLVNNAGVCFACALEEVDPDEVATQVAVNFLAPVFACQAIIPHLRNRGGGRILNVTSASARHMDEFAHIGLYSSTKAALERYTAELREELKADNIGVTALSPGGAETMFGSGWRPEMARKAFAEWVARANKFDGSMAAETVGEAIANCFELPPGTAYDYVDIRPVQPMSRQAYAESLYAQRRDNP